MSKDGIPDLEIETDVGGKDGKNLHERFTLDNPSEMFDFIMKVAFDGKGHLEMAAILNRRELQLMNVLANQIWTRIEIEKQFPTAKTMKEEYVLLLREYLRFTRSYKGTAMEQLMDRAIAGLPKEKEKRGWSLKKD